MSTRTCAASLAGLLMLTVLPEHAAAQSPPTRITAAAPEVREPRDPVVDEAVRLIKKRFGPIPRIYVVDPASLRVKTSSTKTPAFRIWYGDQVNPNIFVNKFGDLYKYASSGDPCALKSLAGVLAHEVTHTRTKDEMEPSRVELGMLDEFLRDPSIGLAERTCLTERRKTVVQYGGIK